MNEEFDENLIEIIKKIRANSEDITMTTECILSKTHTIDTEAYEDVRQDVDELITELLKIRDNLSKNFSQLRRKI